MKIDREAEILTIGGKSFMIEDEGKFIRWEMELPELNELDFSLNDFHEDLIVQTSSVDGFGSYLFYDLEFFKTDNGIEFVFRCHQPNKYWEGQWGLSTLLVTLADIVKDSADFNVNMESLEIEDDWKSLEISFIVKERF